jgi:hypothetical protein
MDEYVAKRGARIEQRTAEIEALAAALEAGAVDTHDAAEETRKRVLALGDAVAGLTAEIDRLRAVHKRLRVLLAWEVGELSEGQAARALSTDRVTLRGWRDEAVAEGCASIRLARDAGRSAAGGTG